MADDRKQPLIRSLSRARFLGLLGFGAAGVLASRWVRDQLEGFRYNTVERPRPAFDPATYRLRVDGMVARPLDLTYDELLALPRVRQTSDFHCVEGWGVDDVRWEGLSLQSLMERVGPAEGARFITFHSMGGVYADSLTIEQASSILGSTERDIEDLLRLGDLDAYVRVDVANDSLRSFWDDRAVAFSESTVRQGTIKIPRHAVDGVLDKRDFTPFEDDERWADSVYVAEISGYLGTGERVVDRTEVRIRREDLFAGNSGEPQRPAVAGDKLRVAQMHRQRCEAVAALLWRQAETADLTIEAMIDRPEILEHGQQHQAYTRETLRRWIKEVAPPERRKPGRPRKKG